MSTTTHRRVALRRCLASAAAVTIGLGGVLVSTTVANAAPTPSPAVDLDSFTDGRYVVQLVDDGAALYAGGIPNLQRTAPQGTDAIDDSDPAVVAYTDYLEQQQAEVADSVDATVAANLTLTMNGFVADLSAEQAGQLTLDSRVEAVVPDELLQLDLSPANEYLDVEGMWSQVGGVEGAGEGVVVGVLDTGIAPENPLFAGEPLGTTPGELPYLSGSEILFEKGDGETFTGTCQTGPQFTADMCNTKIVGAQYFLDGFGLADIGPAPIEVASPRDLDGHGSHTASTAAGNHDVPVTTQGGQDIGTMSGVAPEARIAVYKVCWSGPDATTTDDDGCASTDLLQGVEAATADGVDVINFSIGGGAAASVITLLDEQFLGAAAAGVFISASAGNSGPGASTLDHASPWYTTVANTTIENYEATIAFTDPAGARTIPGASITVNMDPAATPLSGEMVYAGDIPLAPATPAQAALCLPSSIDPAQAAGLIVICDRGTNDRVQKSAVVLAAGGIGMIHTNPTPNSVDLDDHSVPTVHVDSQYRAEVLAAAEAGSTATFTPGNTSGIATPAPIVAASSSRGPAIADGSDVIKPDIAAPGTGIIAAGPNAQGEDPAFIFLSGTSMAAPHVAGLAAVYLGANPDATPAEIKSALMTTATDTVDADGSTNQDWFAQGAGFVNTADFLDAGVYYANGTEDWYGYLRGLGYILPDEWVGAEIDPSDLNIPSIGIGALAGSQTITRTLTSLAPGSYDVTVDAPEGIEAVVTPTTLDFTAAGQELSYTVEFTATESSTLGSWASGSLTWDSGDRTARSPIAILPVALDAPTWIETTGTSGTETIDLLPGLTADIAVGLEGLFPFQTIAEGAGAPSDPFIQNVVQVPAGETLHYFTAEANDQSADLDLIVQRLNGAGTAVQQWTSATASADEQVMIQNPTAGAYRVIVDVYSAPTAVTGYTIEHVGVSETGGEGTLTADPSAIAATVATPTSYDLSWTDLDRGTRYLGFADYSTADGVRTYVEVDNRPERVWGADRFDVAVDASQLTYPDGAGTVYLASGVVFPDGLSAGPAAAQEDAPLLLTRGDVVPESTLAEIDRLQPDEIVIVGGPATISAAVVSQLETELAELSPTVTRVGGADRFEVSRNIAERAFPNATTAFVATGITFSDALTAGAAAGAIDAPVLLVDGRQATLDAGTRTVLQDLGVDDVYVAGGPRSVPQGILTGLTTAGFSTERITGADRFEVGVNINEVVFTGDAPLYTGEVTSTFVASGLGFTDALSASAAAAAMGAPLYVAPPACLPAGVIAGVDALGDPSVYLMGGTATLSPAVRQFTSC